MAVGGDDDTVAGSLPAFKGAATPVSDNELIAGRYRIMRWLGGGGMGRVYEALDSELGERVALKVLKAGMSDDAVERFRREVKLTRRIQHRNVCRMFDIGEHGGERFLTMELVEGEPLTRKMSPAPMAWDQLKAIAIQICDGLAAAHEAGVVHRDLKPDNVLVESATDRVVLTDFGIARSGDDPSVTQVGAIVGTPRYMSPEQLAGRDVDARADVFSLGVMLFELATATRPWSGDNAISIAVSQATSGPRSMDTVRGIPAYFVALVASCLQLEPNDRPASVAEIATALREDRMPTGVARLVKPEAAAPRARSPSSVPRPPATMTAPEPTTLAVVPIQCAPGDEYLADGLLEELTDTLSTTPGIRVRPAGIVRDKTAPDARELGQKLQVDHVVTASLRRTAKGLRIATRLIGVADGFQIWAHKTDCTDADVLDVADELAKGIAEALSTRATAETRPTDPRAVDFYLRARAELRRFWGNHAQTASTLLEQAVEYAPTSAPILAAAAYAAVQTWVMRGEPELLPKAQAALARGLATGHGEAYLASAQFHLNTGDLEHAAADLGRALVRAPMSAQTHELTAKVLLEVEGVASARTHYETARGLDPGRGHMIDNDLARADALEQKWADSEARVARMLADPDMSIQQLGIITQARLQAWRGRRDVMVETARTFVTRVSPNAGSIFYLVSEIEKHGHITRELWEQALQGPAPDRPRRQYLVRLQICAELAFALDQRELGLEALRHVANAGLMDRTWLENCPLLAPIAQTREYNEVRDIVNARAAQVLTAFRGTHTRS
jgi:serine/threonine-protein kinase